MIEIRSDLLQTEALLRFRGMLRSFLGSKTLIFEEKDENVLTFFFFFVIIQNGKRCKNRLDHAAFSDRARKADTAIGPHAEETVSVARLDLEEKGE